MNEFCNHGGRRVVEDHAVEHAVEDVACSPSGYHGQADQIAPAYASLDTTANVPCEHGNCRYAERSEEPLGDDLHAECHPIILCEENLEPVRHADALVQVHAGLDRNLDGLVDCNDAKSKDYGSQYL